MNSETPSEATVEGPRAARSVSPFKVALTISAAVLLATLALSAWAWSQLPADSKVPIHWNAKGEADGFAGRTSLFLIPCFLIGITVLFAVIPFFEPRRGHLLRSSKAYQAVWLGMILFFLAIHGAIVWSALGNPLEMNAVMGVALGLLFIIIGNYLGKVRSNFMFGIRTPWTLSSELSWNKTHRLGGRLFVLLGIVLAAGGLWNPGRMFLWAVMITGVVILVAATFVYSWIIWKNDPDKAEIGRSA